MEGLTNLPKFLFLLINKTETFPIIVRYPLRTFMISLPLNSNDVNINECVIFVENCSYCFLFNFAAVSSTIFTRPPAFVPLL